MDKKYLKIYYEEIKKILKIQSDYYIEYITENAPSIDYVSQKINIVNINKWNNIYQLSHELMHACFAEHNVFDEKNIWIEEIICESFSIYCLNKYAFIDYDKWCGYNVPDMYKKMGFETEITVSSIIQLNAELKGFKSYAARNYVHNIALTITKIIKNDWKTFEDFWKYTDKIDENGNLLSDNSIAKVLNEFITMNNL